jgi:hypothetical protein
MDQRAFLGVFNRFVLYRRKTGNRWKDQIVEFFYKEAERKHRRFPDFTRRVDTAIASLHGFREHGIDLSEGSKSRAFFEKPFFSLIKEWIELLSGLPAATVETLDARTIYEGEVLYKCRILLPFDIFKRLEEEFADIIEQEGAERFREIMQVFSEAIAGSFNIVLDRSLKITWLFVLLSSQLETTFDGVNMVILFSFNDYTQMKIDRTYFDGNLLEFLVHGVNVTPSDHEVSLLTDARVKFMQFAHELYMQDQPAIASVVEHFRSKVLMTGQLMHLYELVAFLIPRLDLCTTPMQTLLSEFVSANSYEEKDAITFAYLLNLVTQQALLFTTFQSNYTGLKDKIAQVFILVLQYYLGFIEKDYITTKIYQGEKLFDKIGSIVESDSKSGAINGARRFDEMLELFLSTQFPFLAFAHYDDFVRMIFSLSTETLIGWFFASFLKTSQEELLHSIEKLNADAKLAQRITFTTVVSSISDFLSFCMNRVFLKPSLHDASMMFKDPLARFSEDNIALAMVELLLYRELPFQDNQWMATLMAQFGQATLGEGNPLVPTVLARISSTIFSNYLLHDRSINQTTPLLDAWFFDEIIKPLHLFGKKLEAAHLAMPVTDATLLEFLVKEYGNRVPHLEDDDGIKQDIVKIVRAAFALRD